MLPERDELLHYTDFNRVEAHCRLRTYRSPLGLVVVLTEVTDNPGASITNNVLVVLAAARRRLGVTDDNAMFIEHYDDSSYPEGRGQYSTFARISAEGFGESKHKWQHMPHTLVLDLLGPEIIGDTKDEFPV